MSSINSAPPVAFSGDVQIGAVEIKDGVGLTRVDVVNGTTDGASDVANLLRTTTRIMGFNGITWDRFRTGQMTTTSSFVGFMNALPYGRYVATQPTLVDGQGNLLQLDANGNLRVTLATAIEGEDSVNHVMKVEQQYSYVRCTADTQIKGSAGILHEIVVTQPASTTPTAGVLTIYDSLTEANTVIFQHYFAAAAVATPVTIPLDVKFATGCYLGFDGTLAALAFTVAYR